MILFREVNDISNDFDFVRSIKAEFGILFYQATVYLEQKSFR